MQDVPLGGGRQRRSNAEKQYPGDLESLLLTFGVCFVCPAKNQLAQLTDDVVIHRKQMLHLKCAHDQK